MVTKNDLKIDYCFSFHTISVTIPATNKVITQYNIPLYKGIHLCLINDMVLLKKMQMEYSQSAVSMATISILGGCHGNHVIQLSSPCLPWVQHPTPERARCKLFHFF